MRQVRKLGLLVLTGCTVAATTACTAPSPSAGPPVTGPSASSGPSAATGQGPAGAPSKTPSKAPGSSSAPAQEPPAGQGGQSNDADWARIAFRTLACKRHAELPARAEIRTVHHADLTGDGRRDTVVAASCPTTTSTNAVHIFVFGAGDTDEPLLTIGKDSYLRTADVQTRDRRLTVRSEAISDKAPLCCPDLRISQSWKWTGSDFTRTAFTSRPI